MNSSSRFFIRNMTSKVKNLDCRESLLTFSTQLESFFTGTGNVPHYVCSLTMSLFHLRCHSLYRMCSFTFTSDFVFFWPILTNNRKRETIFSNFLDCFSYHNNLLIFKWARYTLDQHKFSNKQENYGKETIGSESLCIASNSNGLQYKQRVSFMAEVNFLCVLGRTHSEKKKANIFFQRNQRQRLDADWNGRKQKRTRKTDWQWKF